MERECTQYEEECGDDAGAYDACFMVGWEYE